MELMAILVIIGMAAAISTPKIRRYFKNWEFDLAVSKLETDIRAARDLSISKKIDNIRVQGRIKNVRVRYGVNFINDLGYRVMVYYYDGTGGWIAKKQIKPKPSYDNVSEFNYERFNKHREIRISNFSPLTPYMDENDDLNLIFNEKGQPTIDTSGKDELLIGDSSNGEFGNNIIILTNLTAEEEDNIDEFLENSEKPPLYKKLIVSILSGHVKVKEVILEKLLIEMDSSDYSEDE